MDRAFISLAAILVFVNACGASDGPDPNDSILLYGTWYILTYTVLTRSLSDNKDGTTTLTTTNAFGQVVSRGLFKRCAQGQVYRALPVNDCRGSGTAADGYGAAKLQWCSTDDLACNPNWAAHVSGSMSEIYVSCTGDSTAGASWYPALKEDLFSAGNFRQVYSEVSDGHEFWLAQHSGVPFHELAEAVIIAPAGIRLMDANKTLKKMVFCGTAP